MPEKNELKIAEIRGDLKNLSQRVSSAFPDEKTEEAFLKKLAASDKESYGIKPNPGIIGSKAKKNEGQGR